MTIVPPASELPEVNDLAGEVDPDLDRPSGKEIKRISRSQLIWRRFFRNKTAVVGLILFGIICFVAIFGTWIAKWSYKELDQTAFLKGPTAEHWFGTNQSGSDLYALTIRGLRKSLIIGLVAAVFTTGISAVIGSFAAYFGKWVDQVVLRVINLLLVIPSLLIIAVVMRGSRDSSNPVIRWVLSLPDMWLLIVMLTAFSWMLTARVVRSITQSIRDRDYVRAAKFMGVPGPTIVFRHIIPNLASLLVVDATLNVGFVILGETGLSFLGFGIRPPDSSLGTLISDGQSKATTFPWTFLFPSLFLVLIILAVNMIGDGLRDAFDPTSQSGGQA